MLEGFNNISVSGRKTTILLNRNKNATKSLKRPGGLWAIPSVPSLGWELQKEATDSKGEKEYWKK